MRKSAVLGAVAALSLAAVPAAQSALISATFQEGTHGERITNKFLATYGFTVSADNFVAGHPDKAIIFDSRKRNTADYDLEGYNQFANEGRPWSMGNLQGLIDLGKMLIIAENDIDANNDGFVDSPDDEGGRPAGKFTFNFNKPITQIGFNLVDIEGPVEFNNGGYFMAFYSGNTLAGTVNFSDFITPGNKFYDSTVKFGDHSANRIKPILASQLNAPNFTRVEVTFGGSGAIDQLKYEFVPEPASLALAAVPALLLGRRRRD